MHTFTEPSSGAVAAGRHRRDRALRLRRRIVIGVAATSTVALGGFAAVAQHTDAGAARTDTTTGSASTAGSGASSWTDSGASSQSSTPAAPAVTSAPSTGGGAHAVSGGS